MSTKMSIFIVFICIFHFAYSEQDFVVSFGQQCKQGIWNGRAIKKIGYLERTFHSLQDIQEEYKLATNKFSRM